MSALVSSSPSAPDALPATLVDALAEAVAFRPDPTSRAAVICDLVSEVSATLQWRHGYDRSHDELASFGPVVAAAQQHRDRMGRRPDADLGHEEA